MHPPPKSRRPWEIRNRGIVRLSNIHGKTNTSVTSSALSNMHRGIDCFIKHGKYKHNRKTRYEILKYDLQGKM